MTLSSLLEGYDYSIKVQAQNIHGWGPWSEVSLIRAADQPSQPAPVVTVEENVYVALSWVAPESNHLELTELQVQVLNALTS
jgi:hypothetical protein